MSHAFIAHGADQFDSLLKLHEALRAAGVPAKYSNSERRADIDAATIDAASLMIVLVSYDSMRSNDVRSQILRAKKNGLTILPVRADRSRLSGFIKEFAKEMVHSVDDMDPLVAAAQKAYRRVSPVVSVMNMKGGIGKTTIASQLAAALQANARNRVLLIDFDPQYNLTQLFFPGQQADEAIAADRSVISLFEKSRAHQIDLPSPADQWATLSTAPFTPAPRAKIAHSLLGDTETTGRLDIIFGQFEISKYAFSTDTNGLEAVRANFLRSIEYYRSQYDLIVLDTNPNATFLTRCALQATDRVLAPMHTDIYSLRGVRLLNRVINDQTTKDRRPELSVLFNAVERREQSDFEADTRNGVFDEQVEFDLSSKLMSAAIPKSRHFRIKGKEDDEPIKRLLPHHGRGGGLRQVRESLLTASVELAGVLRKQSAS
jgi:cellulose biosynthesis protein BcsQ